MRKNLAKARTGRDEKHWPVDGRRFIQASSRQTLVAQNVNQILGLPLPPNKTHIDIEQKRANLIRRQTKKLILKNASENGLGI